MKIVIRPPCIFENAAVWAAAAMFFVTFCGVGCSEEGRALSSIRGAYRAGNYEEAIVLCQHAFKRDIASGEVIFYHGLSLIGSGRDYEGLQQLDRAVNLEAPLRVQAAAELLRWGRKAVDAGDLRRGAVRLKVAVTYDPDLKLKNLSYLVGNAFFADKDFGAAARHYRKFIDEYPDTSAAEVAYYNLADCYVSLGDMARAVETLNEELEAFPQGVIAGEARWRLASVLYSVAEKEFSLGNYDSVVETLETLLVRARIASVVQKARFLLGEAYERLENYPKAYEQYREIIDEDRGASGRIVERAKEKIEALRDSGLI